MRVLGTLLHLSPWDAENADFSPDGEIDGPWRAPEVRPAFLSGHGLHENRDDRGVALEVARSSVSEQR